MDSARPPLRELKDVGRCGRLDLRFELRNGRTIIGECYSETPHKITRLHHPDDSSLAQLIVMNSAPGLFGGDRVQVRLHASAGSRVAVLSQSSLKVHPGEIPAEHSIHVKVDRGAELHLYNDPIIPFAGSSLRQRMNLEVDDGGRLYYWDGLMAGRVERGERWMFAGLDTETRLRVDGKLLFLERYRLPQSQPPNFNYAGLGLFHDVRIRPEIIHQAAANAGVDEPEPGLTIVRAVTNDGVTYRSIQDSVIRSVFRQIQEPTLPRRL